jgi:fructokinase
MFRIGLDLGGTKIEGIVLDEEAIRLRQDFRRRQGYGGQAGATGASGEILRKRVDTQQEKGYDHILSRIQGLHDDLAAHIQNQPHTFGIGTPGAISPRTGLLKNSNTVCMNGRPLRADLERLLGRKIEIQNDANCFAMA